MSFRFRRSLRLAPGLRINLAKHGASLSLGGRGLTANFGRRGARTTVGLPGSGLSAPSTARLTPPRGFRLPSNRKRPRWIAHSDWQDRRDFA